MKVTLLTLWRLRYDALKSPFPYVPSTYNLARARARCPITQGWYTAHDRTT